MYNLYISVSFTCQPTPTLSTFTANEAASKPYVSRRKRHRRRQEPKLPALLSTRSVLGALGLLVLALIVSLGIIASQMSPDALADKRLKTNPSAF